MRTPELGVSSEEHSLEGAKRWIVHRGVGFSLFVVVVWPTLCLSMGVFSEGFFFFWVFVSLVWGFVVAGVIICLPIWESSEALSSVATSIFCSRRNNKNDNGVNADDSSDCTTSSDEGITSASE
mmetsp:Transcript_85582/g.218210  ORF Transcript_85582/g.218210 Transcript_85582/m.218210 type:complete len:124 (-) Transcript_85582:304-675(-)